MPFDPENYLESLGHANAWKEFIDESEPILKKLEEYGCTKGEALIVLWLNRILNAFIESMYENDNGEEEEA